MSNLAEEILEELFFIISYKELLGKFDLNEAELNETLAYLYEHDYIELYVNQHKELLEVPETIEWSKLYYFASKKGLKKGIGIS